MNCNKSNEAMQVESFSTCVRGTAGLCLFMACQMLRFTAEFYCPPMTVITVGYVSTSFMLGRI